MTKIILVSDNHYNYSVLKYILEKEKGDLFLHCGDSELDIKLLEPFLSVKGNNDYDFNLPPVRYFDIEGYRVMMLHGNPYVSSFSDEALVNFAINNKADVVLFGHTHRFANYTKRGIRFINPGSCNYNRDGSLPSYARVYIEDEIICERVNIDPKDYLK